MGKSTINRPCSIATLNYQRVTIQLLGYLILTHTHLAIYIQNWMIAGSSHGGFNGGFHTWGVPHIIYDEKNIEIDDLAPPHLWETSNKWFVDHVQFERELFSVRGGASMCAGTQIQVIIWLRRWLNHIKSNSLMMVLNQDD